MDIAALSFLFGWGCMATYLMLRFKFKLRALEKERGRLIECNRKLYEDLYGESDR